MVKWTCPEGCTQPIGMLSTLLLLLLAQWMKYLFNTVLVMAWSSGCGVARVALPRGMWGIPRSPLRRFHTEDPVDLLRSNHRTLTWIWKAWAQYPRQRSKPGGSGPWYFTSEASKFPLNSHIFSFYVKSATLWLISFLNKMLGQLASDVQRAQCNTTNVKFHTF